MRRTARDSLRSRPTSPRARFRCPRRLRPMVDDAPSATGARLLSARNPDRLDGRDEKPTCSTVQGRRLADGLRDQVDIAVIDHQLELHLRDERDAVFEAAIEFGMWPVRAGAPH